MTDPIDFQGAVELAIYDRLHLRVRGAQIFQNVPDNTPPPVVIIGDVDWADEGDKDGQLLLFNVVLTTIVAGRSRKPLNALQAQSHAALHRWTPPATSLVRFGEIVIGSASGQEVQAPGGPVYFGNQQATLYVQPVE